MSTATPLELHDPDAFRFYRHALEIMGRSGVPFLLGGAYALGAYTGVSRHTKDLDLFIERDHVARALAAFAAAGYRGEVVFSHWLAKVFHGDDFIDVIFSSGNSACPVDGTWFEHAVHAQVLGTPVHLMPAEEMIWQKAYIMERERFDGADVLHMLRARGRWLDWRRLLARLGEHWPVLLSHLVLYGFVYPDHPEGLPSWVLEELLSRVRLGGGGDGGGGAVCHGTLLSRTQYLPDTEEWGYADPRRAPRGAMTEEQVRDWTDAGR